MTIEVFKSQDVWFDINSAAIICYLLAFFGISTRLFSECLLKMLENTRMSAMSLIKRHLAHKVAEALQYPL